MTVTQDGGAGREASHPWGRDAAGLSGGGWEAESQGGLGGKQGAKRSVPGRRGKASKLQFAACVLEEATWWTVEVTASCCRVCLSPGCFSMNLFMKEEVGNGYTGRCGVSPDVHGGFIDIIVVPWHHPVTCPTQLVSSRAEPHV